MDAKDGTIDMSSLLPSTRAPYPFRLPTPFITARIVTCTPPPRCRIRSCRSQQWARQHLNLKLPQLRQGRRRRREGDKSATRIRSGWMVAIHPLVVPVSPPPSSFSGFSPSRTCLSFSLPRSLPSLSPRFRAPSQFLRQFRQNLDNHEKFRQI